MTVDRRQTRECEDMPFLGKLDKPKYVLDDMARSLRYPSTRPANIGPGFLTCNVLTIDVEDYFQVSGFEDVIPRSSWDQLESRVERNTDRLLELLAEFRVRATFFVLGWTAERHPALVRRIQRAGHELGCHSYSHRLIYRLSDKDFREDTRRAKGIIEDLAGAKVIGYRAPSFSITRKSLWAITILAEEGFKYDSSIFPIFRDRYGIPGTPRFPYWLELKGETVSNPLHERSWPTILEIPPTTVQWLGVTLPMGGGGYLRLCPSWAFHHAIRRLVEVKCQPAVVYLHPWELDPEQPYIATASWLSRFRHYVNLDGTEKKLRGLLSRWRFSTAGELVDIICRTPITILDGLSIRGNSLTAQERKSTCRTTPTPPSHPLTI